MEEPLKEHPKRKRPKSRSKSSNDRRTDEERSPPENAIKIVEKMTLIEERLSWRKKKKKKKHQRYSSWLSSSSSSINDSDGSKHRSNERKEGTDSRFRVISEDQYKYHLPPDVAQYAKVNFDYPIKGKALIKAVLIKNPVPKKINPLKTLITERYP